MAAPDPRARLIAPPEPIAHPAAQREWLRPLPRNRREALKRMEEMYEHHSSGTQGGRLRAAVFGINDGLVTNTSLVIGVAAANPGRHFVLLAGIAGLVAGAFSMAAGEYISMSIQREVYESQIRQEQAELHHNRQTELEEMITIFVAKGLKLDDAIRVADQVMSDPEVALDIMARDELGLNPNDLGSPWGAAISSFVSFAVGAFLPLLPFILGQGTTAFVAALIVAAVALAAVGAASARLSGRPMLVNAARSILIGGIATGITYVIGRFIGVSVS